jgi:hypothetical protein
MILSRLLLSKDDCETCNKLQLRDYVAPRKIKARSRGPSQLMVVWLQKEGMNRSESLRSQGNFQNMHFHLNKL